MPGLRADLLKKRREAMGFDQATVAALLPSDDDPATPWPRALLSMVENRKVKVRGLTPMYLRALEALEHERTHNASRRAIGAVDWQTSCKATLGPCGYPHLACSECAACGPEEA